MEDPIPIYSTLLPKVLTYRLGIYLLGSRLCEVQAKLCGQGNYLLLLILLLPFL